jgi:hypothetical protein
MTDLFNVVQYHVEGLYDALGMAINGSTGLTFSDSGRIQWTKYTAYAITLDVGTSSDTVDDIKTAHDEKFFTIIEVASEPGVNLTVFFSGVTAFNWVKISAAYDGAATHGIAIQLYNYTFSRWDSFDSLQLAYDNTATPDGYILEDHSFLVPNDTEYIEDGRVKVRFYHTPSGNTSHRTYIDVVALYQ